MVGFLTLILGVLTLVHYYLWRRLIRSTTSPGRIRRVLTWILVGLGLLAPVTLGGSRSEWGHFLAWPGFFWLAVMFYLFVFLLVLEIPRAMAVLALRVAEHHVDRWTSSGVAAHRLTWAAVLVGQSAPAGQPVSADRLVGGRPVRLQIIR